MAREFFDHTGDVGVALTAHTVSDLFREAALAFVETLTDLDAIQPGGLEHVELDAGSLDDLMISWIDELLYRFEVRNMLPREVALDVREDEARWRLTAAVRGERFDPERHVIKVLIKGVTYHQLDVRHEHGAWRTNMIFDI